MAPPRYFRKKTKEDYAREKQRRPKKKRRLDMHRLDHFTWELRPILVDLPENVVGTIKGSLIAKASKIDIDTALDFVYDKVEEGVIPGETADEIQHLLKRYSKFR